MAYLALILALTSLSLAWILWFRPVVVNTPEEAVRLLSLTGSFPKVPKVLSDALTFSLIHVSSLPMERLYSIHRSRKLMHAFLRSMEKDGETTGYAALLAEQSLQLNFFIAGVLVERFVRALSFQVPAFFTCAAVEAHQNLAIITREACAELRPDLFASTANLVA